MKNFKEKAGDNNIGNSPLIGSINNTPSVVVTEQVQTPVKSRNKKVDNSYNENDRCKCVQTKITLEDFSKMMDLKIKRGQSIFDILNEAIHTWISMQ